MPDSIMICGEPIAPALSTTSLSAMTATVSPLAFRYSTPTARQDAYWAEWKGRLLEGGRLASECEFPLAT